MYDMYHSRHRMCARPPRAMPAISISYRKLAMKWHPDKNKENTVSGKIPDVFGKKQIDCEDTLPAKDTKYTTGIPLHVC